jgi:YVTN family beta-propeller protein
MTQYKKYAYFFFLLFLIYCNNNDCYSQEAQESFDGNIKNNSLAISPDESIAVASNSDLTSIVIFDLKSNKLIKKINGFINPRNIIFSPSGKSFYITDSSLGTIYEISSKDYELLKKTPIEKGIFGSDINKDGQLIYINNQAMNTVTILDLNSNSIKSVITGFAQPRQGIKLNFDNSKAYITNFSDDKIRVIDTNKMYIESTIQGFNKIRGITLTKDGGKLFVANSGSNNLALVNLETGKIEKEISVGKDPYGVALSPNEEILVSSNRLDNSLTLINAKTLDEIDTITGFNEPRQAIIFSKNGALIYVLNKDLSISIVNVSKRKVVAHLKSNL